MTAMAPSCPMSFHVGEMTLLMMSAASSNSSPRSSHIPKRRQRAFRSPSVVFGVMTIHSSLVNASIAPNETTMTAAISTSRLAVCAMWVKSSSITCSEDRRDENGSRPTGQSAGTPYDRRPSPGRTAEVKAPFSDALFRRSVAGERAGSFRFEVKIRLPAHVYPHAKDGAAGERAWRLVILADVVPTITADAETVPRQRELAHLRPHRALPHDLVVYVQFGRPDRLAVLPGRLADELDAR